MHWPFAFEQTECGSIGGLRLADGTPNPKLIWKMESEHPRNISTACGCLPLLVVCARARVRVCARACVFVRVCARACVFVRVCADVRDDVMRVRACTWRRAGGW